MKATNNKIMNTQEINITFALNTAKAALTKMAAAGFVGERDIFVLSNMIADAYSLTSDQAIFIIEEAVNII